MSWEGQLADLHDAPVEEPVKLRQVDRALRRLRQLILSGELQPEQHLSEPAAAEMIGISRTPLREAMTYLVEEGLLERTSSGRCKVCHFTREDIFDAIEFRGILEGTVARFAAERGANPEHLAGCKAAIKDIDDILGESEAEIKFDRYSELNEVFHGHLARISNSATLRRELLRAHRLPLATPSAFLQGQMHLTEIRRSLFGAQAQHKALISAIENREGARAEAIAREHAHLVRINLAYVVFENNSQSMTDLSLVAAANHGRSIPMSHQGRKP